MYKYIYVFDEMEEKNTLILKELISMYKLVQAVNKIKACKLPR